MDKAFELTNEKALIEQYLDHPLTRRLLKDAEEEQEGLISLLTTQPIHNIETFFAHFEAIGHLRGLRRTKGLLMETLDAVNEELKNL